MGDTSARGRALLSLTLAIGLGLCMSGCVPQKTTPSASPTPSLTPTVTAPPTSVAPLRGTTVPAGSLDHASIAAKIDNLPSARPQIGLESTDLVYQELVEGGLTRYVAVWQSSIPALIGPVRSIRPMDPDIVSPLGGIICYSGGQQRFVDLMRKTPVYNAIHGQADTASTFFRTPTKAAPHNVLVKAPELLAQHADIPAPAQQFQYASAPTSTAATAGTPTAAISYAFSGVTSGSWTWDAAKAVFLRSQGTGPDLDSAGAQLSTTNVVVMRVTVTVDQNVPKTNLMGSGEAWISSGGRTVHASWTKASATDPIHLADDAGAPVLLAVGNTWIELVPTAGSVSVVAPG
ncbi:DUF3048 domain-containing protein [Glaciihabitans sp. INWT7]|uniref:DUF3048 domain-containing protein n=1 Tax=Glaciihabitans sp. INWT7 TaxID=2596912 RepID=UPI001623ED9F|nr:DUF3048 domain-containing protein [Glaciihabitans sp. INWT7]QNE47790.1 DUF3048 domain-containing protein [Glaciihabitans sp. INWT7]